MVRRVSADTGTSYGPAAEMIWPTRGEKPSRSTASWAIRLTCSRSLAAPDEITPKRVCSAARPAMATTIRSCRCCCEVRARSLLP